jgi:hypothetical protein
MKNPYVLKGGMYVAKNIGGDVDEQKKELTFFY